MDDATPDANPDATPETAADPPRRRASDAPRGRDGTDEMRRATARLARRLPESLQPLATLAYNYRWSWTPGGRELFADLGAHRFALAGQNPVRLLRDLPEPVLVKAAADEDYVARLNAVSNTIAHDLARPSVRFAPAAGDGVVAFCCAEFAVHSSLPVYSGGLGVLAGDILKEASDLAYPFVGVGIFYRRGYFHQRIDLSGWQHEYWIESDPETMPMVKVTDEHGLPLAVTVPVWDGEITLHVWRTDIGRVPLYLLDAEVPDNQPRQRWVTARLYEGSRQLRLAQYAVLGIGGVRMLAAMGIDPGLFHLNEGHPALAAIEVAGRHATPGRPLSESLAATRDRFVFTTHTPVPAGNETYSRDEMLGVLGRIPESIGFFPEEMLAEGRVHMQDPGEPVGLTPLAIRAAASTNGVSRRHGAVARAMWQPLFPDRATEAVPIGHVTNGVHLPTWMAPAMRALLDRHLGAGWEQRSAHPDTWAGIDAIPDEELWAVRCEQRAQLVEAVRRKVAIDRLARGEDLEFVKAAERAFDPDTLTVGFARRVATYKRLGLLVHDPDRAHHLVHGDPPLQLVIAGKAHPLDDAGKGVAQRVFNFKRNPDLLSRVVFMEDYDMRVALSLVAGCDVWLNLPRPPMEASGTSGMKAVLNGGLNVSVMDGWWAEAYDGTNGWGFNGHADPDEVAQDTRDATVFYDIIEHEVKPLFYERDEAGIPRRWLERVRASLKTLGPRFSATRMVEEYGAGIYRFGD